MQTSSEQSQRAWLLSFSADFQAAVAYHEMSQVLISPPIFHLAPAPDYCRDLIIVQNQILPIMNMAKLLNPKQIHSDHATVGVALYQRQQKGVIQSVGLYLTHPPESIQVSDEQACDLPDKIESGYAKYWTDIALSCFLHQGKKIPIIDLAHLFSLQFRQQWVA